MLACSLGSFGTGCQWGATGEQTLWERPLNLCRGRPAVPAVHVPGLGGNWG